MGSVLDCMPQRVIFEALLLLKLPGIKLQGLSGGALVKLYSTACLNADSMVDQTQGFVQASHTLTTEPRLSPKLNL